MAKSGQARVLTPEQQKDLFISISNNRHPEKNTAIMQISFKLGLRAQEIALLEIKEIAYLGSQNNSTQREFKLLEVMSLPASYTKGANALNRSQAKYERKTISFKKETFDQVVQQITALAKAGAKIDPSNFYPPLTQHKGKSRDLPLVDNELRKALVTYLTLRLERDPTATPSSPLFLTQKGGAYSPNTLQEHMALMLRGWAGIEKSTSHSGRRSLITNIIHKQKKSVKIAQKIAGHISPSTTILYEEPPEEAIGEALSNLD